MPGMAMPAYGGNNTWTFIAGYSAAKLGDFKTAELAEAMLRSAREKLEAGPNPYQCQADRDHGKAGRRAHRASRRDKRTTP